MGLERLQTFLARLYTDPTLRGRFGADPRGVCAEAGLDPEETDRLINLSARQVGQFAGALVAKRRNEVEKLLPRTVHALGPERFAAHFRRFAAGYVPSGIKKHRNDARRFAEFLDASFRDEPEEPAWVVDLVRFEAALLAVHDASRRWVGRRFRYALDDLAHPASAPREQPTFAFWFRFSRRSRPRFLCLSLPRWVIGNERRVPGRGTAQRSPGRAGRT